MIKEQFNAFVNHELYETMPETTTIWLFPLAYRNVTGGYPDLKTVDRRLRCKYMEVPEGIRPTDVRVDKEPSFTEQLERDLLGPGWVSADYWREPRLAAEDEVQVQGNAISDSDIDLTVPWGT